MILQAPAILDRLGGVKTSRLIVLVLGVSTLSTLCFWAVLPPDLGKNESADYTDFYEPVARRILAGCGFTHEDQSLATRYPPGYPLLLAGVFGLSTLWGVSENLALSALILISMGLASALLFIMARSVWGSGPALITSLGWVTYPFSLWLTKQPNSEVPFTVLVYGSLCLLWHLLIHSSRVRLAYFAVGLLAGGAMLIRPIAIGVGLVMGAIIWTARRGLAARSRLVLVTMLLIGNLVAILPWQVYVYHQTQQVILLSTGGALTIRDGLTFAVHLKGWRQGVTVPQDVQALMRDLLDHYGELDSFAGIRSAIVEQCEIRPEAVAKLLLIKAARSWYATDSGRFETPALVIQAAYLILILWASWWGWRQGGRARQLTFGIWLMVGYFWVMTVLALSIQRYMVPAMGLLFILLPAGLTRRSVKNSEDAH